MLVRSSSTPILGSLLSSSSSPSLHLPESPTTTHHHLHPISCSRLHGGGGGGGGGIRRAFSEGSLSSIPAAHKDGPQPRHHHRRANPTLETIPSFSARGAPAATEEDDEGDELEQELAFGHLGASSFAREPPLFLARGLGIDRLGSGLLSADGGGGGCFGAGGDGGGGGGGGGGSYLVSSGSGGDQSDMEMRYKRMVEDDPSNALFLRNYAQFLYQVKGDDRRAEEYYSRAILADPNDGELLSHYAKLIWDVRGDEERASSYFERAARASPHNSHVLAAHAAFLWDTDDGNGPDEQQLDYAELPLHASLASAVIWS